MGHCWKDWAQGFIQPIFLLDRQVNGTKRLTWTPCVECRIAKGMHYFCWHLFVIGVVKAVVGQKNVIFDCIIH